MMSEKMFPPCLHRWIVPPERAGLAYTVPRAQQPHTPRVSAGTRASLPAEGCHL